MSRNDGLNLTPIQLCAVELPTGRFEVVEWFWPSLLDFVRTEDELMLEMSLPPLSTDASASFPDLAPGHYTYVGTLFARLPGIALKGRSDGGHIRVVRLVLNKAVTASILRDFEEPSLTFLQSLLNIRSDPLRALMRMANRELTNEVDRSAEALEALSRLVIVELKRVFDRHLENRSTGRLATWQYRRIRDRLAADNERPTVAELARLCGISVRHLHRQFQMLTGETLSGYIENHLIKLAKDLLEKREMPIKAIARSCGFSHANSFARAFRRATGLSPQQYRQRVSRAQSHGDISAAKPIAPGGDFPDPEMP